MIKAIVTVGFVGLLKPAPGTWGSFAALPLGIWLLFSFGFLPFLVAIGLAYAVGLACVARYAKPDDDPSEVVIDELVGQWIALLPLGILWEGARFPNPLEWGLIGLAFVAFRLFDIRKPWLVGRADRLHGATGIMLDDVIAGFFAACFVFVVYAGFIAALIASNPWGSP